MTAPVSLMDAQAVPAAAQPGAPDVSVIVTVIERPEPLADLYHEYSRPLAAAGYRFEFVFVLQPFFHEFASPLVSLAAEREGVRVIEAPRVVSETALLRLGLSLARGRTIVTLPAYHQVTPSAVPALLAAVGEGADLVVARRWPRQDALVNRMQSRALHLAVGRLASGRVHDVACGVRAGRREVFGDIPLYGDFGRFLPLLALHEGFSVREVDSPQHPKNMAPRLYGPGTYVRRVVDLLGLFFLLRFTEKPLRFFGLIGATLASAGALILLVMLAQRIAGEGIAGRPMLLLGVLLVTMGFQSIALGLIGEMIVHFHATGRRSYRLRGSAGGDR